MPVRGVRGATVAVSNQADAILSSTRELLRSMLETNPTMEIEDLVSAIFSLTEDLDAAFPAAAARQLGWNSVPLMCFREISVPGSLPLCIRVLLHWNTELPQKQVRHVYLGEAIKLRPDLTQEIE